MPAPGVERTVLSRQYTGVVMLLDPSFIGKEHLQFSQNFHPAEFTFLLAKRRGTVAYATFSGLSRVDRMLRVLADSGNRYTFGAGPVATHDVVEVLKNDAALFLQLAGVTGNFTSFQQRYGMCQQGNFVYVGNGIDPIKEIPLVDPITAVDLSPLTVLADTYAAPPGVVVAADAASTLRSGTISYRWGVYDSALKRFVRIGAVRTVTTTTARQRLDFTSPNNALGGTELYRLFVSQPNEEIEGAHDQTPQGLGVTVAFSLLGDPTIDGVPVPIPSTVTRAGSILVPHLGRVFIAGNTADPRGFFATDVLRPGLEQTIFDNGTFFPANAFGHVDDRVTAMAVASLTTTFDSPSSPLAIFTETSTSLLTGDIMGDPSAELVQLSNHHGCISAGATAYTPMGLVFVGHESVYLLRPDIAMPVDIGWPIWRVIRAIPRALRAFVECVYHKGFLKVAIPQAGATGLDTQWWLDLRRPFDPQADDPPWWGPMVGLTVTCFAVSEYEPLEDDRAWAALPASADVTPIVKVPLIDQPGSYADDGTPISSVMTTARLDDGAPFARKLVTRVRAIGNAADTTSVQVGIQVDGMRSATGILEFTAMAGVDFNVSDFNVSNFQSSQDSEATFQPAPDRPRGQAVEVTLSHSEQIGLTLRDVELAYEPIERRVG